jgi:hypothetical protein
VLWEEIQGAEYGQKFNRREAIKQISVVVGGTTAAIVLPSNWTKPVMDSVVGPAAAVFVSYCDSDGRLHADNGRINMPWSQCPQPTTTGS